MNKKSVSKALFIIICITLIFSFIASQDVYHLDLCHDEHCHRCSVIHYAQKIVKLCVIVLFYITIYFSIILVSLAVFCGLKETIQKSLVFQKVQFNE